LSNVVGVLYPDVCFTGFHCYYNYELVAVCAFNSCKLVKCEEMSVIIYYLYIFEIATRDYVLSVFVLLVMLKAVLQGDVP